MRLYLDTNVVLSAILFPNGRSAEFFRHAVTYHTVVLGSYVIDELRDVFQRKFPTRCDALETFLDELSYEKVTTPQNIDKNDFPEIRDPKDLPVIACATESKCDYHITGDKDLHDIKEKTGISILSPGAFLMIDDVYEDP